MNNIWNLIRLTVAESLLQFAKVETPNKVWCEVLPSDMRMLERTNDNE